MKASIFNFGFSKISIPCLALFSTVFFSCHKSSTISSGMLKLEINNNLETRINSQYPGAKRLMKDFATSEYVSCSKFDAKLFDKKSETSEPVKDQKGSGIRTVFHGTYVSSQYGLEKILAITVYDSFPDMAFYEVKYVNIGKRDIGIEKWINHACPVVSTGDTPAFWSFQGSSTNERKDWMLPVDSSFYQKNYMGMNNTDYGGGIPLVDLWRKDAGIAIGHVELKPYNVSLPVEKDKYDTWAQLSILYEYPESLILFPGDTLFTLNTFVDVHRGDCFASLQAYSKYMQASGIRIAPVEPEAYEAVWCGWGYEQRFTVNEIIGTLPKVKELGLKWIDIDHGYQQGEGDWEPDPLKFPEGSADMRKLVNQIHAMGLKTKLWWSPLAVDPCSKLLNQNPDILLLNKDGSPQFITFWDSYYMSPVYEKTRNHTRQVLKMFLQDWDFDGLKMDGMHLNCVPPDFNPQHNLEYAEQSCENLPDFFRMIYETARTYKPNAVLQICPCGEAMSFFIMPWTNQTVASDPVSSWQTRLKGKTYKALLGKTAYYGDHVELSDGGDDFASQIGIGAVVGTKFTWPKDNPYATEGHFALTPAKEKTWKHWISIYNMKMLSKGNYLGELYDIGYDKPETHVIKKVDTLYYSFYCPDWHGEIELRGLGNGDYQIVDYVMGKDLGKISSKNPFINVSFQKYLLIEVRKM
jgi:alpha-galactosidase